MTTEPSSELSPAELARARVRRAGRERALEAALAGYRALARIRGEVDPHDDVDAVPAHPFEGFPITLSLSPSGLRTIVSVLVPHVDERTLELFTKLAADHGGRVTVRARRDLVDLAIVWTA